ncbi:hypothetical protein B0H11DRAFT_1916176 [Mycena galericulata]|nr:hypothetical protein B0H11DRAFT_1916176 [Mycena galericulata]
MDCRRLAGIRAPGSGVPYSVANRRSRSCARRGAGIRGVPTARPIVSEAYSVPGVGAPGGEKDGWKEKGRVDGELPDASGLHDRDITPLALDLHHLDLPRLQNQDTKVKKKLDQATINGQRAEDQIERGPVGPTLASSEQPRGSLTWCLCVIRLVLGGGTSMFDTGVEGGGRILGKEEYGLAGRGRVVCRKGMHGSGRIWQVDGELSIAFDRRKGHMWTDWGDSKCLYTEEAP